MILAHKMLTDYELTSLRYFDPAHTTPINIAVL